MIRRGLRVGAVSVALALLFAVFASTSSQAQEGPGADSDVGPLHKKGAFQGIGHYIRTHKVCLIADAAVVLGNSADAASTVRAAHYCPTCEDFALGRNPSPAKVWLNLTAFSALVVTMNHLSYHHYRQGGTDADKIGQKFFVGVFSIPTVIHAIADTETNVKIGPPGPDVLRTSFGRAMN